MVPLARYETGAPETAKICGFWRIIRARFVSHFGPPASRLQTGAYQMTTTVNPSIALQDGQAQLMGDGVAVLLQRDERGRAHSAVVTADDLKRLLAALEA